MAVCVYMKKHSYKIYILIFIIIVIITRIYTTIQKTQTKFSRAEQSILYQFTQKNSDCYFQTSEFSFIVSRCEVFSTGEVVQIVGSIEVKSDNTQNRLKRLTVRQIEKIAIKRYSPYYWQAFFYQAREQIWVYLLHPLLILLEQPHSGILLSMVFGKKEYLDDFTSQLFSTTGSTHLQVVSGDNFPVLFAGLYQATSRLAGKRVQAILLLLAASLFLAMLGISPSVVRAYCMLIALVCAKFVLLRQYKSVYALICITLLFLLVEPTWLSSVSFQLTFSATAGIILLFPLLYTSSTSYFPQENGKSFERISSSGNLAKDFFHLCWEACIVSVAAQLATLPILIWYFGEFSLSGLLVTTFLFWLISIITLVGFSASLVIAIFYPLLLNAILQVMAVFLLWLPLEIFYTLLRLVAQLDWLTWNNLTISPAFLIFYYFCLSMLVVFHQYQRKPIKHLKALECI